jgi:hypothetical protein
MSTIRSQDVSDGNDWSLVRVFNLKTGAWGVKALSGAGLHRRQRRQAWTARSARRTVGEHPGATALIGEIN